MIISMPIIQTTEDYLTFFKNIDQFSHKEIIATVKEYPLVYGHLPQELKEDGTVISAFLYKNPDLWTSLALNIRHSHFYKDMLKEYPILLKFASNDYMISFEDLHAYLQVGNVLDLNLFQPSLRSHVSKLVPSLLQRLTEMEDISTFLQKVPKIIWAENKAELGHAAESLLLNSLDKMVHWQSNLRGFYRSLSKVLNDGEFNEGVAAWRAFWDNPGYGTYASLLHKNPILQLSLDPNIEPVTTWSLQDIEPFIQQHIKPLETLCQEYDLYL